jgi:hypothetical protein
MAKGSGGGGGAKGVGGAGGRSAGGGGAAALQNFNSSVMATTNKVKPWAEGSNKVFISDVFDRWSRDNRVAITRTEFDARLRDAARAGAVQLARADLVSAMDPAKVSRSFVPHRPGQSESEIGGSGWHFILKGKN